ncbi:antirestriction protein ArdA [Roseibium album]|uniref:antirestriction protein ArdA n=1 Tax=Roseibium album TaxID=311410 RepID=UPI003296D0EF
MFFGRSPLGKGSCAGEFFFLKTLREWKPNKCEANMTQLFAQPYDLSATGFYFETADEYQDKATKALNDYGDPIEEFEIQFIDGDEIDAELTKVWGLNQTNFAAFLDCADDWDDQQKQHYIIAVGECGYSHDEVVDAPEDIDITLYELHFMKELAEQFVDDGVFGDIPTVLVNYIDYEAISRDLELEYSSIVIAGKQFIYRCG